MFLRIFARVGASSSIVCSFFSLDEPGSIRSRAVQEDGRFVGTAVKRRGTRGVTKLFGGWKTCGVNCGEVVEGVTGFVLTSRPSTFIRMGIKRVRTKGVLRKGGVMVANKNDNLNCTVTGGFVSRKTRIIVSKEGTSGLGTTTRGVKDSGYGAMMTSIYSITRDVSFLRGTGRLLSNEVSYLIDGTNISLRRGVCAGMAIRKFSGRFSAGFETKCFLKGTFLRVGAVRGRPGTRLLCVASRANSRICSVPCKVAGTTLGDVMKTFSEEICRRKVHIGTVTPNIALARVAESCTRSDSKGLCEGYTSNEAFLPRRMTRITYFLLDSTSGYVSNRMVRYGTKGRLGTF